MFAFLILIQRCTCANSNSFFTLIRHSETGLTYEDWKIVICEKYCKEQFIKETARSQSIMEWVQDVDSAGVYTRHIDFVFILILLIFPTWWFPCCWSNSILIKVAIRQYVIIIILHWPRIPKHTVQYAYVGIGSS